MKLFSKLTQKILMLANHKHAPSCLAGVSFIESSVFPIAPDVMLIPMIIAKPKQAWRYASITTVFSVLGGLFGYLIGLLLIEGIYPYLVQFGYKHSYDQILYWFKQWGIWAILLAGISPIPYKLFTIGAGAMHMALFPFILCSIIGRGIRFFVVTALIAWGGLRMKNFFNQYVEKIGWLCCMVVVGVCMTILLTGCGGYNLAPVVDGSKQYASKSHEGVITQGVNALTTINGAVSSSSQEATQGLEVIKTEPVQPVPVSPQKLSDEKKSDNNLLADSPQITSKSTSSSDLIWPVKGKVIQKFSGAKGGNQGIEITNKAGTPIVAVAEGQVVYSGSGLAGYGKLLIIKHKNNLLTAYSNNSKLFVSEGEQVKSGQKIAEMGSNKAGQAMLHFEVRRAGKPEDPLKYLPAS